MNEGIKESEAQFRSYPEEIVNKPRGPWFTKTREVVYENDFGLKVFHDKVLRPNKSEGIYGFISVRSGSYTLPLDNDGNVYLISQFRYPANIQSIEAASGGRENKESYIALAKRELEEELGIRAKNWVSLSNVDQPAPHIMDSLQYFFLAMDLEFSRLKHEETEQGHLKSLKMNLEKAVQSVRDGKIVETPTRLLIMLANDYLENTDLYQQR